MAGDIESRPIKNVITYFSQLPSSSLQFRLCFPFILSRAFTNVTTYMHLSRNQNR